jgi:molecular chaperone DnaK
MLSGIREGRRGEPKIEVRFDVDADGIAHVSARDVDTGAAQTVTVTTNDDEELSPRSLQFRVASLVQRISALTSRSDAYLDEQFRAEIEELLRHARSYAAGDRSPNVGKLQEYRMALEAVLAELNTLYQDMEVGSDRA